MIFKVTYEFSGEKTWCYYKVSSLMRLIFCLHGDYVFERIVEIKRLRCLPKGVDPIEL